MSRRRSGRPVDTVAAPAVVVAAEPVTPEPPSQITYLLVFNSPHDDQESLGPGWTLVVWHGDRWRWSMGLFARGAGPSAPPRVAQAVTVRVLAERGVDVDGWQPAGGAAALAFRAQLATGTSSTRARRQMDEATRPRRRRRQAAWLRT